MASHKQYETMPRQMDPRAPRFNQGVVGALALAAFVFEAPFVVPALALLLAAGAFLGPHANPLSWLWRRAIVPGLRLGPPAHAKDAAPVRFAQAVGFVFLLAASLLLFPMAPTLAHTTGWALTLLVAALALLAAATDLCVGCEAYVLLRKWTARTQEV